MDDDASWPVPPAGDRIRGWVASTWRAARPLLGPGARALVAGVLSFAGGVPLFVLTVLALCLIPAGVGILLLPPVTAAVRALANDQRRRSRDWFGVDIPEPYRPAPASAGHRIVDVWRRCGWLLSDPATWRDLLWLLLAPVSLVLGLLPAALIVNGVEGIVVAPILTVAMPAYHYGVGWFAAGRPDVLMALLAVPQGALLLLLAVTAGPGLLRGRTGFTRALLAPSRAAALGRRVRQLTSTRAEAVDASAAELRRIERDLHDGAQARLVAMGMSLGMAEDLMTRDPRAARRLLVEARQANDEAQAELRSLVRGIHPPVLAERGLDGAVRALALTLPIPVDLDIDLPGRLQAPIETAAYFAVAEALANVVKHSAAGRAWVWLRHREGTLSMVVGDDGVGGVEPGGGTGVRGIERRLAAHDGTLVVTSPIGGPTVLTMVVPCGW